MTFILELQATLSKYNLLNHQFYQYWNEGKLTKKTLAEYAKQYYHHVEAFPQSLSAIHSLADSMDARKIILQNLMEEENSEPNHPELWLNFAEALGVSTKEMEDVTLNNYTKRLLEVFRKCSHSSYEEGLGALYAHEWQYSEIAKTKKEGLKKYYSIDNEEKLQFFTIHGEIDIWHSEQLVTLLQKIGVEKQQLVLSGAKTAAKALWGFLDGMLEYHNA